MVMDTFVGSFMNAMEFSNRTDRRACETILRMNLPKKDSQKLLLYYTYFALTNCVCLSPRRCPKMLNWLISVRGKILSAYSRMINNYANNPHL